MGETGKTIAAVVLVISAAIFLYFFVLRGDGVTSLRDEVNSPIFIDEDGKVFRHRIREGEPIDNVLGSTGKKAFPAEFCWWTKDGKIRESDPIPVLLEQWLKKPGPTFCPDCNRLVTPNNSRPQEGSRPPPTRDQMPRR
jgi:hypothetical protein